ncbi:MAG TPA: outer membrane protein assembly factor BamD [Cytophaga sp.]|jgi:outer membrane protein assembly factor BamD|nr:outer membrane protein assembly factor BamD [Cytophaga sp.]
MPLKRLFAYSVCILIVALHSSCSDFNRLQKTGTPEEKLARAIEYYNEGETYKAGVLLEDISPILKGKAEAEQALYYLANNYFKQKQYIMSAFYFKDFYLTYPRSKFVEETMYMHVYSLYLSSADYNLDQQSTYECLKALSVFSTRYPNTTYLKECETIYTELNAKLMHKAYEHSMMYHKVGNYKSAVVAISNFIKDYPNSPYIEESYYTRFEAQYHLAKNSVQGKVQIDRYYQAIEYYQLYVDKFPDSKHKKVSNEYYDKIVKTLEELKSTK